MRIWKRVRDIEKRIWQLEERLDYARRGTRSERRNPVREKTWSGKEERCIFKIQLNLLNLLVCDVSLSVLKIKTSGLNVAIIILTLEHHTGHQSSKRT
ncbi:hypothetical protein NPIL_702891 [Nephila pilipes]|uniref:Uncharacterized protein n=1 Tax=Nephila pilipes TaxID=299642 RepID=A0A8X6N1E7_NEPPI|nr:hypothetical protein NPIL_702891 [Nephila pilipes]